MGKFHAHGEDCDGRYWLIVEVAPGRSITEVMEEALVGLEDDERKTTCEKLFNTAMESIHNTLALILDKAKVLHSDHKSDNVFFSDDLKHAALIDWGSTNSKAVSWSILLVEWIYI